MTISTITAGGVRELEKLCNGTRELEQELRRNNGVPVIHTKNGCCWYTKHNDDRYPMLIMFIMSLTCIKDVYFILPALICLETSKSFAPRVVKVL